MKTIRIQEEVHERLTTLVGELTAQSGRMQTYADALTNLLETSIILPEDLLAEISDVIKKKRTLGYTTAIDFVRDAVRRRLEEIKSEEFYVNVPIPQEEYELLNKALEETDAPYKNADDYIREHIHKKLEEYEEFKSGTETS